MENVKIRPERPDDRDAVYAVHAAAFKSDGEARLVGQLRRVGAATVSLVAELDGKVVGHILFSPVNIPGAHSALSFVGLAPVGVLPEYQRKGIGGALIRAGLERCRDRGVAGCVLLGSPDYYPRFGFLPASIYGLRCVYDAPSECFQAMELRPGAFEDLSGTVFYHDAFAAFE